MEIGEVTWEACCGREEVGADGSDDLDALQLASIRIIRTSVRKTYNRLGGCIGM